MDLKLFVATKAFVVHEGKVLVLRENSAYKDGTNVGKYDIPGGRITPGERLEEALAREVLEETGLECAIGAPFFADESTPRPVVRGEEWQIVKVFFRVQAASGEVHLSEDHDDFKWIDPREYREADLIPNLHAAFEAYLYIMNVYP